MEHDHMTEALAISDLLVQSAAFGEWRDPECGCCEKIRSRTLAGGCRCGC